MATTVKIPINVQDLYVLNINTQIKFGNAAR